MADKRLFFALWPDERQRTRLRDTLQPMLSSIEGRKIDRKNWHVTLVFIGAFPEEHIDQLLIKAKHVECEPFRLRFDQVSFWPGPKLACMQTMTVPDELKRLKSDLEKLVGPFGIEREQHEYRPHITAALNARPFETVRLARPMELQWTGFELIESIAAAGGSVYRPLKQQLL